MYQRLNFPPLLIMHVNKRTACAQPNDRPPDNRFLKEWLGFDGQLGDHKAAALQGIIEIGFVRELRGIIKHKRRDRATGNRK